ncbi:CheY-like chemotaxis protein [Hydrogenophaga palleronii]|uniref:CheY-like chemotaxis protein n=1 Tax=Hydrogenophaga palleronii TaxID=65655 RepID=A0ABU1WHY1_9BURK|nr:response regulator [Hydrogenophaga palleronii]MDR7148871.1 CheY-like chemotaxis protein [Hydrogenophaga palleronii]
MTTPTRFILIDDNEADNVFHEIMIRRAGFDGELLIYEDASEALAFLQKDSLITPTCIFLDINMPLMDGFEFARNAAHLLSGKTTVRLMMLTSSDAPQDRKIASEMPLIQDFITKPLTVQKVRDLLMGD